jgi:hypothetical protein
MSYYDDERVRAGMRISPFENADEASMTGKILVTDDDGSEVEMEIPLKFEVCDTCQGTGEHVNPSIDCDGLTCEDFDDDPDFAESYCSGAYNVTCYGCGGKRVQMDVDLARCSPEQKKVMEEMIEQQARDMQERAWERKMGC